MNRLMENKWSWVEGSHQLRTAVLNDLTDADLAFNPGGQALSLGELWREFGEIEHAYVQSFKTFTQDFNYRNSNLALNVTAIKSWFEALDTEMQTALAAFSDADLDKMITRGSGFELPIETQVDIYLQALLIFLGKLSVYLKAMNKPLSDSFRDWVG